MARVLPGSPFLTKPGVFITATDTGVGKTVIACAVARALQRHVGRVGICKPFATGCHTTNDGLVSEDTQALAHFTDHQHPLDVISPIRYQPPLAPAPAARAANKPPDLSQLVDALRALDRSSDALIVEGIGGLLVPLTDQYTTLDLIEAIGYPVVVVTRAGLGTLNHTAMTVTLLRNRNCHVAGLIVNGYEPESTDASMTSNVDWLHEMNQVPVLATVPACPPDTVAAHKGQIHQAVLDAIDKVYWPDVVGASRTPGNG